MYIISFDVASKSLALSIIYFNHNWKNDIQKIKDDFHNEVKIYSKLKDVSVCVVKYLDQLDKFVDTLIVPKIFDVVDLIPGKKLKDTTPLLRASRLNAYLTWVDSIILDLIQSDISKNTNQSEDYITVKENYKVLLEYQMGPNDKSRAVCSQILYHFSPLDYDFKNTIPLKTMILRGPPTLIKATDGKLTKLNPIKLKFQNKEENENQEQYKTQDDETQKQREEQVDTLSIEIIGPSLKNKIDLIKDKPYSTFIQKYTKSYDANKAHSKANFLHWIKVKKVEHMIKGIKKSNIDDIADSVMMSLAWLYIKSGLV